MTSKLVSTIWLALLCISVRSTPVQKRQGSDLNTYIKSVNTALYVLANIDTASNACLDIGLVARLNAEGYDGVYAKRLLCVGYFLRLDGLC